MSNQSKKEELAAKVNVIIAEYVSIGGSPIDLLPSWIIESLRLGAPGGQANTPPRPASYASKASAPIGGKKSSSTKGAGGPSQVRESSATSASAAPAPHGGAGAASPSGKSSSSADREVRPLDNTLNQLQRNAIKHLRQKIERLESLDLEAVAGSSLRARALAYNARALVNRAAHNVSQRSVPVSFIPAAPVLKNVVNYNDPQVLVAEAGDTRKLKLVPENGNCLAGESLKEGLSSPAASSSGADSSSGGELAPFC